ncbi:MAG: FAD-dependent oxidoreductase [Actinomycetota bacterium]
MQTDPTTGPPDAPADVIVIGAGLAGLAAAIDVRRAGRSVVLLDARRELGGRARTVDRDGFLLNEGAHALYRTGAAFAFLCREGLEPAGGEPASNRAVGVSLAEGLVAPLPAGLVSLLRTPLLRGERMGFGRMFAGLNRLDTAALDGVSVADGVRALVGSGRGAAIVHALLRVATYGNDPAAMSAGAAVAQLRDSLATPVRYVDGGWRTIVDGLRRRVVELGATVLVGEKARTVREVDDVVEVVTGDAVYRASAVVIAAGGPRQVDAMTGIDPAPFARPSTVAALDVGLGTPWGSGPTFAVGLDDPLYLSVHAPVADLAPTGGSLVSVMRYHRADETPDADEDRQRCEHLLDRVRPRWRDDQRHATFRPRLLATHDQPQAERSGLVGRAGVALPGHARVSIAGDWVGPDGLLADATFASAAAAAVRAVDQVTAR